jgi:hypothetical protein
VKAGFEEAISLYAKRKEQSRDSSCANITSLTRLEVNPSVGEKF